MRKYDFISALAKETAAEVVKNREEWINTDAGLIVRYAVCCKEKGQRKHYPEQIKIAERDINYKDGFLFDAMTETIKIFCYSDLNLLNLIIARGKELGFSEL